MAIPQDDAVAITGNPQVDALTQGSAWTSGGGAVAITYSFSVNDNPDGGAWTSALEDAVRAALAAWSSVANITFIELAGGQVFTGSPADIAITLVGDQIHGIGEGLFPGPASADAQIGALGYTPATYPNPEGDVFVSNSEGGYAELGPGGAGEYYFLHLIGHSLGLKHSFDQFGAHPTFSQAGMDSLDLERYTVMSLNSAPDASQGHATTPMLLDIQAIQSIYGANLSYHTGDDTYVLSAGGTPHLETIWDAGGNDTLDASPLTTGIGLDLREGSYTEHGGSTTAIAYGAQIENAIGGSGADTIIGTSAANSLDGGAGDDILFGGFGHDQLRGGSGNNTIDGGPGIDTLFLPLDRADYRILHPGTATTFSGGGETQTVRGVESVHFGDGGVLSLHDVVMRFGDTNGDGRDDILWRNTNGTVAIWNMDGTSMVGGGVAGPANLTQDWSIQGTGDFDGDGRGDLLWRHADGSVAIWTLSGASLSGGGYTEPRNVSMDWQIAGTGDFNADGRNDIAWRNDDGSIALWLMNGTTVAAGAILGTTLPQDWSLAGTGDFNGDGRDDLLWHNDNGSVAVWLMNGLNIVGGGVPGSLPLDWGLAGTGDLNGDGRDDILWRNSADGSVAAWLMSGDTVVGGGVIGAPVPADWTISGTGDYNGDGRDDILWHNDSGAVAIWLMGGLTVVGGGYAGPVVPTDWHIV